MVHCEIYWYKILAQAKKKAGETQKCWLKLAFFSLSFLVLY